MKKRILSVVLALLLAFGAVFSVSATDASPLKFDENGEFTIMHLTDCQDTYPANTTMLKFIDAAIKEYQPDIVVLGGDNTDCALENKDAAIKELTDVFVANKTYFTLVFGNHDHEQGMTNDDLLVLYQKHGGEYCLAYDAVPELHGSGTHMLHVASSDGKKTAFALYMFDSGDYVYDENGNRLGYDCVTPDQIEWYKNTSDALTDQWGNKVPAFAFQHIIVGDVYDALFRESPVELGELSRNFNGKTYSFIPKTENFTGFLCEFPCPGYYNYGQFDAMVDQGDVLAVYSGHDHTNGFVTEIDGVKIINTPGASYQAYGSEFTRGARIITVNEKTPDKFDTEVVTVNGFAIENEDFANDAGISVVLATLLNALGKVILALGEFTDFFSRILG